MLDLPTLLTVLAQQRAVFHSEADFQLALAWQIKQQVPSRALRLEKRAPILAQRVYADIWVTEGASWPDEAIVAGFPTSRAAARACRR